MLRLVLPGMKLTTLSGLRSEMKQRLRGRDGEAVGVVEGGGGAAGAVVEALADGGASGPGEAADFADAVVAGVGDVEVAADVRWRGRRGRRVRCRW